MPGPTDTGFDFAAMLGAAMKTPDLLAEVGKDLPDGFPLPTNDFHKVVTTEEEGIVGLLAYDFKVHREVYTTFRPWEECSRCGEAFAAGRETVPSVGDYTCPHVTKDAYEAVVNDILSGKLMAGSEQEIVQKDGVVRISLKWYEKLQARKKKQTPGIDGTVPEAPL